MHETAISAEERDRIKKILSLYDFPFNFPRIVRNTVGYINKTYIISEKKKKYVLRESNSNTDPKHIYLEVEILHYLADCKFKLTAKVYPNKKGKYLTIYGRKYYMLQSFVEGKPKASWNNLKGLNIPMLESLFSVCAVFAKTVAKFHYVKKIENKTLYYYVKNGKKLFSQHFNKIPKSKGRDLLSMSKSEIFDFIEKNKAEFEKFGYDSFPKQIVHFDLHAGNANYIGNKVSGIFDFDWARFDSRISDIAATISQTCYYFGGKKAGLYKRDWINKGLHAYFKAYGKSELSHKDERQLVKIALKAYNFFQVLWCMDFYQDNTKGRKGYEILLQFNNIIVKNNYDKLFA